MNPTECVDLPDWALPILGLGGSVAITGLFWIVSTGGGFVINTAASVGGSLLTWGITTLVNYLKDSLISVAFGLIDMGKNLAQDVLNKASEVDVVGFFEDLVKGVGSLADGVTMDLFDFDQSGGNLPGAGLGESVGLQGADSVMDKPIPEANKVKFIGIRGKIGPGTLFLNGVPLGIPLECSFNGSRKIYILVNLKKVDDSDKPRNVRRR